MDKYIRHELMNHDRSTNEDVEDTTMDDPDPDSLEIS